MRSEDELFAALKYQRTVDEDGTVLYHNTNGKLHRDDGPALIYPDGEEHYYKHGVRHRENGPAIVSADGWNSWFLNGLPVAKF